MTRSTYFKSLRFVLLPLALLLLANIIFSLVAFNIARLVGELKSVLGTGQILVSPFLEARARLAWGTTVLLFYATMIAVSIVCVTIIHRSLTGNKRLIFLAVGTLITIVVLGHLAYSGYFRTNFSYIFFFTFDTLRASQIYTASQLTAIKSLVSGINVLAGIVSTLALVSGCCLMSQKRGAEKANLFVLVTQMSHLKSFIGLLSAMLVTGVLHMIAWLHWPPALITNDSLARRVIDFSDAMGLYWGATFSLLIATFYIPAAWFISNRAEAIITEYPDQIQGMERQEWLKKHNMSLSPYQQIPELVAMLAPILVGPIGATITKLSSPFSGG